MLDLPGTLAPFIGHQPTLLFPALLGVYVLAGMICVATGAVAARLKPSEDGFSELATDSHVATLKYVLHESRGRRQPARFVVAVWHARL
jgi:hypothetical protein